MKRNDEKPFDIPVEEGVYRWYNGEILRGSPVKSCSFFGRVIRIRWSIFTGVSAAAGSDIRYAASLPVVHSLQGGL